ncbi:MAG TPA: hypothetical protein VD905_05255 [Flavobacteriales bacterium]|nr:hypothetical protein [Flavobacteriales bacterium]
MNKTTLTAFVFTVLLLASCGEKRGETKEEEKKTDTASTAETTPAEIVSSEPFEYVSEAGRYKINFKSRPDDEETKPVQTAAGNVNMYITMLEQGTMVYMTAYADFPAEKMPKTKTRELLQGSKNGIVQKFGAQITDEKWADFQGNPAVDFTATGPQFSTAYKLVLAGNRLYQIGILKTGGAVNQHETDSFIGSFEIINNKPAE